MFNDMKRMDKDNITKKDTKKEKVEEKNKHILIGRLIKLWEQSKYKIELNSLGFGSCLRSC